MLSVYPRKTEKAYGQSKNNIYIFDAPIDANKQQIMTAIQDQFNVTIVSIKTLVQFGKKVRVSRGKRGRPGETSRKDTKKAYVTLVSGDSIKVFDEDTTNAETTVKTTKKEKK